MSLQEFFQENRWTEKTAKNIFPILVLYAKNGKPITYSQLDREIVKRKMGKHVMVVQYGKPAGVIGNALIELEKKWKQFIPPLNALIINGRTGIPGDGCDYYLQRFVKDDKLIEDFTRHEKLAIVNEIHDLIFSFDNWDKVLKEFRMIPLNEDLKDNTINDNIAKPTYGGWSSESESEYHKNLKDYVAKNPVIIGLNKDFSKAKTEQSLPSGDEVDVLFKDKRTLIAVEIKSRISNDNDLNRGIFQCIKYQSVLRALQKANYEPPTARAILVTERQLTPSLEILANLLGIKVIVFFLK